MLKSYFESKIHSYAQQYFTAHPEVTLVAVAGTIGKSSTKRALATVLSQAYRVRMHDQLANTSFDVDLALLGIEAPAKWRLKDMRLALKAAKYQLKNPPTVDVIIQDLVVDKAGAMAHYGTYLHPTVAVVTAVTSELLDSFGTLEATAREELAVAGIAEYVLINRDDVPGRFADFETNANFNTYGSAGSAEFRVDPQDTGKVSDIAAQLVAPDTEPVNLTIRLIGEHMVRPLAAAAAVGVKLGMTIDHVVHGLESVTPLPGRVNPLRGLGGSIVLDDTWEIDPVTAVADLQTLYRFDSPSRIAVLGSMYHEASQTQAAHEQVGAVCNPDLLSWVVTVGLPANDLLAPIARRQGCQVHTCRDAFEALSFVRSITEESSVILVKGGAEDMLEEMVKDMVEVTEHSKLIRQTKEWLDYKQRWFSRFA